MTKLNASNVKSTQAQRDNVTKPKPVTLYRVDYQGHDDSINACAAPGKAEALKSAYSTAVFEQAGYINKVSKAGTVTKSGKPGNYAMLYKLAKALKHFYKVTKAHPVLIDADHALNEKGQVWLHNRLSDVGPAFNTESQLVEPFRQMIRTGKPVEIKGYTTKAIKPVKVTIS